MSHSVWHQRLGISLNLTLPDLGHPTRPGLWEQLLDARPIGPGILRCMGRCYERNPNGPEWMYLRERDGRREAVHLNPGAEANHAGEGESDEHKAFKERICRVTERAGFEAIAEDRAKHGKRITDVLVRGAGGLLLGCEVQLSRVTAQTITRRANVARADGITPFWTTDRLEVPLDNRVPWSRVGKTTYQRIVAGTDLLVTGGVRVVEAERCGRRGPRCPVTRGRPCGRLHAYLEPARGVQLDRLVVGAAAQAYKVLEIPKTRGGANFHWLTAADLARFLDDQAGRPAPDDGGTQARPAELVPKPLDFVCDYRGTRRSGLEVIDPALANAQRFQAAVATVFGNSAEPSTNLERCIGWGCHEPGDLLRCQLCSHSPTYWRNSPGVAERARAAGQAS
jgi:hypothetical protein